MEHVVDECESAATPLILFVAVAIALVVIVAAVMTVAFFAYYKG